MTDANEEAPYSLMCSACYTPCTGADAHVIPRWNPELRRIFTTYRCGNCWPASLAELRASITSGDADVHMSFCDFLVRQGYDADAERIRGSPDEDRQAIFLEIVNALQEEKLVFHP
ncbi:MAG: hypothetical protein JJD97_11500 [Gemmatimonadaceae bacterium]|nr:hypothetical protein [Gemmatimonadaceae bacterium]